MVTSRVISGGSNTIELRRIDTSSFDRWQALLDLVMASFAYMNAVIDPPSSALRLTPRSLKEKAETEISYIAYVAGEMAGCAFFRPEPPDFLYVGKLAVSPALQGRGIGRLLLDQAIADAKHLGLPRLRLETRVELTGNHRQFENWGFVKTAENAHPGYNRPTFIEMQRVA
jgi:ribosomal protein S18 acetylase RimI-like enzyme